MHRSAPVSCGHGPGDKRASPLGALSLFERLLIAAWCWKVQRRHCKTLTGRRLHRLLRTYCQWLWKDCCNIGIDHRRHERLVVFSLFKRKHLCLFGMLHPILFPNLNLQVMGSLLPHFALLLVWCFIYCGLMVLYLRRSSFTRLKMLS
jgi:hypothetical protein